MSATVLRTWPEASPGSEAMAHKLMQAVRIVSRTLQPTMGLSVAATSPPPGVTTLSLRIAPDMSTPRMLDKTVVSALTQRSAVQSWPNATAWANAPGTLW